MTDGPTLFALTPVLNEAWILESFLACASTWADHIVVADQGSEDGSREIAARFPKVTLVNNEGRDYDEAARQRLLIETARSIPVKGRRILIALDADEVLTSNWSGSDEWNSLLDASPGTVAWFDWMNVAPGGDRAWQDPGKVPFGFVDDGRPHAGERIHSRRIPTPDGAPAVNLDTVRVLHYQCVDWPRMRSKQRWYLCWERLNNPEKRPVTLYRQYHHMHAGVARAVPMPAEWTAGYVRAGITLPAGGSVPPYEWDRRVLELIIDNGAEAFRRLDIWDADWQSIAVATGRSAPAGALADPRTALDRAIFAWLDRTQAISHRVWVRAIQRLLRVAGW